MILNNYRITVVTLTTRLPFAFGWLVGDAEWAMGIVRGAHGGRWGNFFHRSGAMTAGATERLMAAYLTLRGPTPPTKTPASGTACPTAARPNAAAGHVRHCGTGKDDCRRCPAPKLLPLLTVNRDYHQPPAPIPRHNSDQGQECTHPGTVGLNGLDVLWPMHLRPPHARRHTTPRAHRRRHADYGRSGTIQGRHATEPPTRACVQTGGTTTPTTTPRAHRDAGTPGITCRERSRTEPHEHGGGGHPAPNNTLAPHTRTGRLPRAPPEARNPKHHPARPHTVTSRQPARQQQHRPTRSPARAMTHLTGRQLAQHTHRPKANPRRHTPLPRPTPPPPSPPTPCAPTPTTPPRAQTPRLRQRPARWPRGTCRPQHTQNRRPRDTRPHQPG